MIAVQLVNNINRLANGKRKKNKIKRKKTKDRETIVKKETSKSRLEDVRKAYNYYADAHMSIVKTRINHSKKKELICQR